VAYNKYFFTTSIFFFFLSLHLHGQLSLTIDGQVYSSNGTLASKCANTSLGFIINLGPSDTVTYSFDGVIQGTVYSTFNGNWINAYGAAGSSHNLKIEKTNGTASITLSFSAVSNLSNPQLRRQGSSSITSENICNNGQLAQSLLASFSGGNTNNNFSYLWEWSTNADFSGSVSSTTTSVNTLAPATVGNLVTTTYFRAKITDQVCGNQVTTPLYTATVYPVFTVDSVTQLLTPGVTSASICHNDLLPFSLTAAASGGNGTYNYQWQIDDNTSFSSPTVVGTGANVTSGNIGALTTTQYVRLRVTSGNSCGTKYSSSYFTITVYPQLLGGTATNGTGGSSEVVCYNDLMASNLTFNPSGGNPSTSDTYQWYRSTSSSLTNPQLIAGATNTTLTPSQLGALTSNTYVFARVTDPGCNDIDSSSTYTFVVYNALTAGQISAKNNNFRLSDTLCQNESLNYPIKVDHLGGNITSASFFYDWYISTNSSNLGNLFITTQVNELSPGSYTFSDPGENFVRVQVRDQCGDTANSQTFSVWVSDPFIPALIESSVVSDSICFTESITLDVSQAVSGGLSDLDPNAYSVKYIWERSANGGGNWDSIGVGTSLTIDTEDLIPRSTYSYQLRCTDSCEVTTSNIINKYIKHRPYTDSQGFEEVLDIYCLDLELNGSNGSLDLCDGQQNVPIRLNKAYANYGQDIYTYAWSLSGASILSQANSGQPIFAYITRSSGTIEQEINLDIRNTVNDCERTVKEIFTPISNSAAPAATLTLKNSTTSLLLAQMSSSIDPQRTLYFRWGRINKSNGDLTYSSAWDTLQYHNYNPTIDTASYIYFVATSYDAQSKCRSFGYFPNTLNPISIPEANDRRAISCFPNPTSKEVFIKGIDFNQILEVHSFNLLGQELTIQLKKEDMSVEWTGKRPEGPVILLIKTKSSVYSQRIILR